MILELLIKCADVSNALRPLHLAKAWSDLVQEEMFLQGDDEDKLGLGISAFMDRNEPQQPRLGITFADFMVIPLYRAIAQAIPTMEQHIRPILLVREYWQAQMEEDTVYYSSCDSDEWYSGGECV
jgi:high affinity cGMP-specific 3',5'-cyclic phosphodiesterase 9